MTIVQKIFAVPFFILTAYLFWASIKKLKLSKAKASEAGMLKPMYLWIVLILNLILVITDGLGIFQMFLVVKVDLELDWLYECSVVMVLFFVQAVYV